jgi:hypothetical protein
VKKALIVVIVQALERQKFLEESAYGGQLKQTVTVAVFTVASIHIKYG